VDIDPQVLLCLLAVRQFGGQSVPAKQDVFSKGLKAPLKTAQEKGWLRANKITVQTAGKDNKPKSSKVDVLDLTPEGEEVLRQAARPEVLAATTAAQAATLRQQLEQDREKLRAEVLAALAEKGKGKPDAAAKGHAALSGIVGKLAEQLEKIEAALQAGSAQPILQKIDEAFATLRARLERAVPSGASAEPRPPAQAAPLVSSAPTPSLRGVLRQAYDDLCQLIEFQDRLVPLPRLYHQARQALAGLSVEAFHSELQSLWDQRVLELQILNEVRTAAEPDKAIRRGDNLYYFVLWHEP
jgi:hypothetical protein